MNHSQIQEQKLELLMWWLPTCESLNIFSWNDQCITLGHPENLPVCNVVLCPWCHEFYQACFIQYSVVVSHHQPFNIKCFSKDFLIKTWKGYNKMSLCHIISGVFIHNWNSFMFIVYRATYTISAHRSKQPPLQGCQQLLSCPFISKRRCLSACTSWLKSPVNEGLICSTACSSIPRCAVLSMALIQPGT